MAQENINVIIVLKDSLEYEYEVDCLFEIKEIWYFSWFPHVWMTKPFRLQNDYKSGLVYSFITNILFGFY